jgi:tight adherence protein C
MDGNPLIEELKIMLNEISLGNSRAEALRNLSERVEMEEISSFTTLLIQADQLGASIGPVLRAQSDSMRSTRFQRAEMKGARAAQMILFPMIFCIFPAIFIIIIGPVLVRLLTQGVAGLF